MALNGAAFLSLWNDVDPARDAEYNCWHCFEHVPERVGIHGLLSGRRYVAYERAEDRYFTLYELEGLAALAGAEYLDVVEHPTAWSLSMRPSLRNFQRQPCRTLLSLGQGVGGAVATFRMTLQDSVDGSPSVAAQALVESFVETAGITSIHLGVTEPDAAFPLPNASATAGDPECAKHVLLVEGIARVAIDAVAPRITAALAPFLVAKQGITWKSFDLAFAIERAGLRHASAQRQPPRPDLRARWP
jgi:hypothetical protein